MLAKSLLVSLALTAASVRAGLYISTPSELKQVSFPIFCCIEPLDTRPAVGATSIPAQPGLCR